MTHSTISNHRDTVLDVNVIKNKEDIKLEVESFDLSKDTKFTIRVLLSYSLFIVAVYFFNLKFKMVGIGYVDSNTNMVNLAELSICLIVIHLIILGVYLWRDRISLKDKEIRLEKEVSLYKKLSELEMYILNSFSTKTLKEIIEDLSEKIKRDDKDLEYIYAVNKNNLSHAQSIKGSIRSLGLGSGSKQITINNMQYTLDMLEKKMMDVPDNSSKPFKAIEKNFKDAYKKDKEKYDYLKSIKSNSKLVMWGINVVYPILTSAFCLFILFSSLNELSKGIDVNKDSYKIFKFIVKNNLEDK